MAAAGLNFIVFPFLRSEVTERILAPGSERSLVGMYLRQGDPLPFLFADADRESEAERQCSSFFLNSLYPLVAEGLHFIFISEKIS